MEIAVVEKGAGARVKWPEAWTNGRDVDGTGEGEQDAEAPAGEAEKDEELGLGLGEKCSWKEFRDWSRAKRLLLYHCSRSPPAHVRARATDTLPRARISLLLPLPNGVTWGKR